MDVKLDGSGFGARPPLTVMNVLDDTVNKFGDRPAMMLKRPVDGVVPDEWQQFTWSDYNAECKKFAKALIQHNVGMFKCINVLGFNSPEWFIANTGAIIAGCIAAGIYTTNLREACHYISKHSKAEIVVVEGNKQLAKYIETRSELSYLKVLVVWGEPVDSSISVKCSVPVMSWEEFLKCGEKINENEIKKRADKVEPGNCSTLIYTSGTTGPPKAVMISHDNITWTTANIIEGGYMDLNHTDKVISYLPLSHIAAQIIDIHAMMNIGGCTYFAQPDALKGSLGASMKEVQPTFFFGVPRVWEKIQEKMVSVGRANSWVKQQIGAWAKGRGTAMTEMLQYPAQEGVPFGYGCANSIVLSKIKEALGLQDCKACFTAAAPISPDTLRYFGSLDIAVLEVFGQSECTGPHTVSGKSAWKIGTCGRPIRGSRSKIDDSTGELCYAGRHIFMGYMFNPEDTAKTIDENGFLHSGDVAIFDSDEHPEVPSPSGFMNITGRIKELIITAGGENIPPVLIENEMKAQMVAISNVMVVGDAQKYLAMMVSLKVEMDVETGEPTDVLAGDSLFVGEQIGSDATTYSGAVKDPKWTEYLNTGIAAANKKTTSNAQVIQKFAWLPQDFSEKAGELTPTLKLKRNVVSKKYAQLINQIYGNPV